jgi:hypothetical protein
MKCKGARPTSSQKDQKKALSMQKGVITTNKTKLIMQNTCTNRKRKQRKSSVRRGAKKEN